MKDQTRRLIKRCLVWLLTLALLSGTVCFGELTGKAEQDESIALENETQEKRTLYIGFNAGCGYNSNLSDAQKDKVQEYHEQAVALMKLVLMMEERDKPAVNITYLVGTDEVPNGIQEQVKFNWENMGVLNVEQPSRSIKTYGLDLINYLKRMAQNTDSGSKVIYWFDRLGAPNGNEQKTSSRQYENALNAILANGQTDIFIAFANEKNMQSFQTELVDKLEKGNRVHVFCYSEKSLEENLRLLNNREISALFIGDLSGTRESASETEQTFVYSLPESAGNGAMLLIYGQQDIGKVQLSKIAQENESAQENEPAPENEPARENESAQESEPTQENEPAQENELVSWNIRGQENESVQPNELGQGNEPGQENELWQIKLGEKNAVYLPADMEASELRVQVNGAADSAPTVSYYLLPTWKGQAKVMLDSGVEKLEMVPEEQKLDVSAILPGLSQANVQVKAEVIYFRLEDTADQVYNDAYLPAETAPADETAASDSDTTSVGTFMVIDEEGSTETCIPDGLSGENAASIPEQDPSGQDQLKEALNNGIPVKQFTAIYAEEETGIEDGANVRPEEGADANAVDTQDEGASVAVPAPGEAVDANAAGTQDEVSAEETEEITDQQLPETTEQEPIKRIPVEIGSIPSADGSLAWRVTIPALEIGEGQLLFTVELAEPEKSILKSDEFARLAEAKPVSFQVTNRVPQAAEDIKTEYDVFNHVPGEENVPLRVDLSTLFNEKDGGQELRYFLVVDGANYLTYGPFKVQDNWLEIAPENEADAAEVTVRACDPYGGCANVQLKAKWMSLETILKEQRFRSQESDAAESEATESKGTVGQDTVLTWKLSGNGLNYYEEAQKQYPALPNLEDALQVTNSQEGVSFGKITKENGVLVLRAVVEGSKGTKKVSVEPAVSFINHLNNAELPLENLFQKWTVNTYNTKPNITQEAAGRTSTEISDYIADFPAWLNWLFPNKPMLVPVAGENEFTLSTLFEDKDTGGAGLYYFITADSENIQLKFSGEENGINETSNPDPVIEKPEKGRLWELKPEALWAHTQEGQDSEKKLTLLMTAPGKANIQIFAWDEAELSDAISINAEAKSNFSRVCLIAGIALAALLVLFGVFEFFYQRSRPSFRQVTMDITHVPYASIRGHLDLKYYGKKNVNFLTLMTAAGMPPLESISSETLSCIELKPLRKNCFRIVMINNAEKQAKVDFDGVKPDKEKIFTFQQKVSILSVAKEEGFTILLTKGTEMGTEGENADEQ